MQQRSMAAESAGTLGAHAQSQTIQITRWKAPVVHTVNAGVPFLDRVRNGCFGSYIGLQA